VARRVERTRSVHQLSATPAAAGRVRRTLRDLLADTPFAPRLDDACTAATELVTNAVLHGREPVEMIVELGPDRVRVEVRDASAVSPTFSVLDPTAVTGRGLLLVAALADHWGVDPEVGGKVVWFELTTTEPVAAEEADVAALLAAWSEGLDVDPADERVRIVLTDLDTARLAAAEAHAEGVLRELALLSASDATDPRLTSSAQTVLAAAERFEASRAEVRQQVSLALAAELAVVDVELSITRSDAELVRDYAHALDTADRLCQSGDLLHEPAAPDVVAARKDYLRRVLAQLSV
jgi:anti-sigma regulatory factor (Ser/Thr protein kinase)